MTPKPTEACQIDLRAAHDALTRFAEAARIASAEHPRLAATPALNQWAAFGPGGLLATGSSLRALRAALARAEVAPEHAAMRRIDRTRARLIL